MTHKSVLMDDSSSSSVSRSVMYNSLQLHGAHQASMSMGFPGNNTRVGCHSLIQGIFLTQGSNLGLLHCRQILYCLSYREALNGW